MVYVPIARQLFYLSFILSFIFRLIFTFERKEFLKENKVEGILLGLVFINGIVNLSFGVHMISELFILLGLEALTHWIDVLIEGYLLILVWFEFVRSLNFFFQRNIKPASMFIGSFLFLILLGAAMLSMPELNHSNESLNFVDSLFTATSASCVTGLTVVDTAEFFTFKGQLVIMFLMQMGGIGILSFAAFFSIFLRRGMRLKHQVAMQQMLDNESLSTVYDLIKRILWLTVVIELFAAIGIYFLVGDYGFASSLERAYYSIFHAISSFCNAGFTVFPNGMAGEVTSQLYYLHLFMTVIVFLGGLGFMPILDFSPKRLRERMKYPWKGWRLSTKISIYTSVILLTFGTLMFWLLYDFAPGLTSFEKFCQSIFQSMNTRTAGFNSVEFNNLSPTLTFIFIFLMFIGASSGSTGGGVKTSTAVVMFHAIIGTISGKRDIVVGERVIPNRLIYKAFAIFVFSILFIFALFTVLTYAEPDIGLKPLIFETISAFGTVGLSMGITPDLTVFGKSLIMLCMFTGRVGIITLAFSLSSQTRSHKLSYPDIHLMIG
jgi:trk system potassium uptake protein TrkH